MYSGEYYQLKSCEVDIRRLFIILLYNDLDGLHWRN